MSDTIFDKIVRGEHKAYVVWQDEHHIAFLTRYPNTPGLTVVIPKMNIGDYVFELSDDQYSALMIATKRVARLLEKAFNTPRIALVFEGTGVAYIHAKLYPLHGELAGKTDVWSDYTEFVENYRGYITTLEGPEMTHEQLLDIQEKITAIDKA